MSINKELNPETVFNETPRIDGTQFGVDEGFEAIQPFHETAIQVCPHCGGKFFEAESYDGGDVVVQCSCCGKRILDLRGIGRRSGSQGYSSGRQLYKILI